VVSGFFLRGSFWGLFVQLRRVRRLVDLYEKSGTRSICSRIEIRPGLRASVELF